MKRPTRAQPTLLRLIAACSLSLLPVADPYRVAATLAGIVMASVLYRQLGARQRVAPDDARSELPVDGERPRMLESTHGSKCLSRLTIRPSPDIRAAAENC